MGGGEETITVVDNTTPFDLNDYVVIKEGEAEILMHSKNEVFYNKTQVNNRDMSIAVLRTFISKRKQEHEALLAKRMKKASKVSEEPVSNGKSEETPPDGAKWHPGDKQYWRARGRGDIKAT
ncbi:probable tRNA (guanine(26)-N(2))-dimethyltransferase 1 [Tanacetum coccineum]